MKRYLLFFATLALMGVMVSCQREQNVPEKNPAVYSNFEVSLSGDTSGSDTKSLIDQVTESRFDKAMLFAFDKNGNILTYGPNAGELEGLPIITSTASKSFVWPLPLNTAMDIYTIVNFGTMDLSSYNKANLTRAELEELTFSCASANDLIKLASTEDEGYGIPQSGILEVSANDLKTGTESLSIKIRRVFARFDLYFDLSELEAKHDHVNVESCTVYNMNTEVKYFPHYTSKNAASHIGSPYDEADRDQRTILGMGGSENKVTLYVLENMQGYRYTDTDAEVKDDTKTPASAWYNVYNELGASKLSKCTFLELNVLLYNNGEDTERAEHRNYRLYLSEDVGSACNFNIPRNMRKTMKIRIVDKWGPGPNVDYFTFVDEYGREERKLPMVNPGETAKLYFKTNLQAADVHFATTDVDSGVSSDALDYSAIQTGTINHMPGSRPFSVSGNDNFYYVNVTVDPSTKVGTKLSVKGGDLSGNGAWDTKSVIVGGVVPEHIGTFIGEWSGFKVGDILEEYDDVYAMIRLYNSDNEPVYFTYHNPNTNKDYNWSTVSASAYSGCNDEFTLGLTNVYYPHIYWDKTKEEFFFYGGKVNDCAYYTAEFSYVVGTDDNGDDVERKESFIVLQNMPAFVPGDSKSYVSYLELGSSQHDVDFDIIDPVTKSFLRNSWFDWGGQHSAKLGTEGSNDYMWKVKCGWSGYTAEGAESYYRSLSGPYSGYLLDQFSIDYVRHNLPSYIVMETRHEDSNAGFDGLVIQSNASSLQTLTQPDENIYFEVSHPFFDNGCKIYPTWSGSKIVVEHDTEEVEIYPVILTFAGTPSFDGLAVQSQYPAPCDLTIRIKSVYHKKIYTFTITKGERYSNEYVDFQGDANVIPQGISISPDWYTEVTENSTHVYRQPYHFVFDDTLEVSETNPGTWAGHATIIYGQTEGEVVP